MPTSQLPVRCRQGQPPKLSTVRPVHRDACPGHQDCRTSPSLDCPKTGHRGTLSLDLKWFSNSKSHTLVRNIHHVLLPRPPPSIVVGKIIVIEVIDNLLKLNIGDAIGIRPCNNRCQSRRTMTLKRMHIVVTDPGSQSPSGRVRIFQRCPRPFAICTARFIAYSLSMRTSGPGGSTNSPRPPLP